MKLDIGCHYRRVCLAFAAALRHRRERGAENCAVSRTADAVPVCPALAPPACFQQDL